MSAIKLESELRAVGYQLAMREMRGDNSPSFHSLRRHHDNLLVSLYSLNKVA